jgi:OmcA/MtrC family decaheme c-type cytochrome
MEVRHFFRRPAIILTAGLLLLGCVALMSGPNAKFTTGDKAFYADEKTVNFVRPGLVVRVLSAEIAADGTAKARVRFTDPRGLPLDRLGVTTPGNIGASFVLAVIPKGQTTYVSYTTRVQTSPITNVAATQASADSGGTWRQVADGEYEYTFRTKAPSGYDRSATHTVHVYSNRNLSEFELGINRADTVFHFVPDASATPVARDIVKTATCNKCHDKLAAHGTGGRSSMEGCITCHSPQTTDPDTGNTVDMATMIHKIHTGADLPSVKAGGEYKIIGNAQSLHDFSHVLFPPSPKNCESCHEQTSTAAQKDDWLKPSRRACGSCHDDVNFATGENHANLPQISDNQCASCHTVEGELEFDLSIKGAHTIAERAKELPGTQLDILEVNDGGPGKRPTVTFSVKDKAGNPILPKDMTRLSLVLSGPNTDFGPPVSEDVRNAEGGNGVYYWTFARPLPETATGSYTVGIEGYRNFTLLAGTKKEQTVRDAGINKTMAFAVTDAKAVARRTIVSNDKCNACHGQLNLHGGNRNTVEQCVLCHNPTGTDAGRRPAANNPAESIDFRTMIHKIHTGNQLGGSYLVYGFGGTPHEYNGVGFPGNRANCNMCHVNNSQQLPLPATAQKVVNPRGAIKELGPETAACTSCHTSTAAMAHAQVNTASIGESCAACHGPNSTFSVNKVHAQ